MSANLSRSSIMSPMSPTGSPTGNDDSISTPSSASGIVSPDPTPSSSSSPAAAVAAPYEVQNRLTDSDREKLKTYNISPPGSPRDATNFQEYNVDRPFIGQMNAEDKAKLNEMGISPPGTPSPEEDIIPEVPTHMTPSKAIMRSESPPPGLYDKRDDVLVKTKTYTTAPSDSDSSDSVNSNDGLNMKPPVKYDRQAHDDYYKKFVEFHNNPSRTINRKPFATGRLSHRHRTHKCKPCKRRRPCKKTIKRRKSHKRRSHKRRR